MSASVLQALEALVPSIPALGKTFPSTLVSQSQSLLALSRQRHPNLKAEEEIARAHVCAEITCSRLRAQLRLPAIKNGAGAPCKPAVYRKLYKFLDASLADAAVGSLTPKGSKRALDGSVKNSGGNGSVRKTPVQRSVDDTTPTKKRTVNKEIGHEFAGSIRSKGKGKLAISDDLNDEHAPNFVMPTLRKLCKGFSTPSMVPHVYTGTCIILALAELRSPMYGFDYDDDDLEADEARKNDILSLLVAVFLMVLTRMRKGHITPEVYSQVSTKCLKLLEPRKIELVSVEGWISKVNKQGWCKGHDWWNNIPEDVFNLNNGVNGLVQGDGENGEDDDGDADAYEDDTGAQNGAAVRQNWYRSMLKNADAEEDDPEGVLLPGLGTMLHPGNDWTSEERLLDYQDWKRDILKKLDMIRRAEERT